MFTPLGRTIRLPESQLDAVTALSGSGPAYFYYLVEAMTDAGILLGLPRQVAHDLIVQSAIGSAIMFARLGGAPGQAARGGHLAGGYYDRGDPGAGAACGPGGADRRPGGRRDRAREIAEQSATQ